MDQSDAIYKQCRYASIVLLSNIEDFNLKLNHYNDILVIITLIQSNKLESVNSTHSVIKENVII